MITRIGRLQTDWEPAALRMLENLSVTWGGSGHMLVPVGDNGEIHEELWELVELYDADRWGTYAQTHRGRQMADESAFDQWLDREARRWAKRHGGGLANARRMLTAEHLMQDPIAGWLLPEELSDRLQRETGVSCEDGRINAAVYRADAGPGHNLVDVTELDPLPERVLVPDTRLLPVSLQLLIGLRTGALAPAHMQRLIERGATIESVLIDKEDIPSMLQLAWLGRHRPGRWTLHRAILEHLGEPTRSAPPHVADDFLDETPMALSRLGCAELTRLPTQRDIEHITVVVGSHADDFAYAMCLDRCGVPAFWLPKEFVSGRTKLARTVRETLAETLVEGRGRGVDEPHALRSLSLGRPMLERLRDRLMQTRWGPQLDLEVADQTDLPRHRVQSLMDVTLYDDPLDVPFDGDEMMSGCPVTVPSTVSASDPWKLTWWVEIGAPGHDLPARSALNPLTVVEPTGWRSTARSGRDGIAFFSHTMGLTLAGSPLEHHLDRPRLRLPSALSVFKRLGDSVDMTIEESAAGRFRRLSEELWGGLEPLAADLRDPDRRRLLDAWLSTARSGEKPGVFTGSRRRFLNLEDACTVSGLAASETRALLDHYLARSILRRGLILQCDQCRYFEWYELEDVGQTFHCRRCRTETRITADSWKGTGDEPAFYYDLVEVVYQALSGNCHVPVAALDRLRRDSRSFIHVPEVVTRDADGNELELDIAAVADGRLVVGEAKSGERLADSKGKEMQWLREMMRVCERLTVDEVVFATASTEWRPVTRDRIASVFDGARCGLRVLEGIAQQIPSRS